MKNRAGGLEVGRAGWRHRAAVPAATGLSSMASGAVLIYAATTMACTAFRAVRG